MIGFVTTKWEYGYIPGPQSKISSVQTLQISITSRIGWAYTKQSGFLQRKCNKTSRQAGELYETQAPELKCLSYEEYLLIVEQLFANRMGWTCGENMDQIYLVAVRSIHEKCIGLMRAMITSRDLIT
ncbi:hypothetical protein DTO166G4_2723 [Paecilomyces variotii]|nr:hypothetical protein DTO166G4_2723 [Paecilomyces variotii]KAJ9223738.1 hypothetical protein DTO169C6_3852 [Paecilomyces variotii]KAJ9232842.1 hypothetical protein DTO166G5_6043 [Paecilomyces variotii]KAJ9235056.1 hypothetical protein DTO169E5_6272 [Paecilomyces variotii]KAJ9253733.1 hypothetical protein DTO195F2_6954 [Paecilomyces variotii]